MSIQDFLTSSDPLSKNAIDFLLSHKEEDTLVDYKESFDPDSEKEWLGITIDVMAFSNTCGGYLVFGVKDATFELVGLSEKAVNTLVNTAMVMQKFNRFISPPITQLRTKNHIRDSKTFVVFYVPESIGRTHIVVKEASFNYPSSTPKILLRPGMIYVRRSGSNQIMNPTDFESLMNRRIERYKEILHDRITRVVAAPPENHVLIVSPDIADGKEGKFIISDAPDAIPVKGANFATTPTTDEEEVATYIALSIKDPDFIPRCERLWHLYSQRHELSLTASQLLAMAMFCLLSEVPAFFWVSKFSAEELKGILLITIANTTTKMSTKGVIIQTGAFLGKSFKNLLVAKLGKKKELLTPSTQGNQVHDPHEFFHPKLVEAKRIGFQGSEIAFRDFLETEATKLAGELSENGGGVMESAAVRAIDCYLYARNDKYLPSKNEAM